MRNRSIYFKRGAGIFVLVIAVIAILSGVIMSLWNSILVVVLGVKIITFWQALGILVLSKILFGGFSKGFGRHRHQMGQEMRDKWEKMDSTEREQFKQQWRNKCSMWGRHQQMPETKSEA
jgi:hypothetical protein